MTKHACQKTGPTADNRFPDLFLQIAAFIKVVSVMGASPCIALGESACHRRLVSVQVFKDGGRIEDVEAGLLELHQVT